MKTLRLILGDQLTHSLASLQSLDANNDIIMLCETLEEATYVKHHQQKLVFTFSTMRHFAEELRRKKLTVHYVKIDDPENLGSIDLELKRAIEQFKPHRIELTFPSEYRLLQKYLRWQNDYKINFIINEDHRFFCGIDEFKTWAKNKKELRMENFYHFMRLKHRILLTEANKPIGGKWNFDKENRKPLKQNLQRANRKNNVPDAITQEVINTVKRLFPDHFGKLDHFVWAVNRQQALEKLKQFTDEILPYFGDYQDVMDEQEPFIYHSLLSPYINVGLLVPHEVCKLAEDAYLSGNAPLNCVEGFIRQILGWREYVRGVYWLAMPKYAEMNYFNAERKLPWFYWTGNTKMNCLHTVIKATEKHAYAHHIQRLMVTGNFALLIGANPKEVCDWYLIVYLDAFDWVELPNTLGMTLYGDGGLLGSKPYAASGKYIDRMSNYCQNCIYNPNDSVGDTACPFNSLYWHFIEKNQNQLRNNQRLFYTYATWNKMSPDKKASILKRAHQVLLDIGNGKI